MDKMNFFDDPQHNSKILDNYQTLQAMGILEHIDKMSAEIRDLESILEHAKNLSSQQSTDQVVDYLTSKLLEKVAPKYLVFIYTEDIGNNIPKVLVYQNMKRVDSHFSLPSFEPYRHFFSLSPQSVDFDVFVYMIDRPHLTDPFLVFSPQRIIPIISYGRPLGFVIVGKKVLDTAYSEKEIRYIERLLSFGSIAFQNALHYQQAILDFKTKLFNHSYFIQRLEEEMAKTKRYQSKFSILMIDVDHFKRFNDTYGHLAGDLVLEKIAQTLKTCIRFEDIAARFGGEEFVILLAQCTQNYAWLICKRILHKVREMNVDYEGKSLKVTVSIGIASCSSEQQVPDSSSLIQRADKALYASKERGRNRATIYHDLLDTEKLPSDLTAENIYREGD
jgi:diguanylate cyclase (GGDEF)-like protein